MDWGLIHVMDPMSIFLLIGLVLLFIFYIFVNLVLKLKTKRKKQIIGKPIGIDFNSFLNKKTTSNFDDIEECINNLSVLQQSYGGAKNSRKDTELLESNIQNNTKNSQKNEEQEGNINIISDNVKILQKQKLEPDKKLAKVTREFKSSNEQLNDGNLNLKQPIKKLRKKSKAENVCKAQEHNKKVKSNDIRKEDGNVKILSDNVKMLLKLQKQKEETDKILEEVTTEFKSSNEELRTENLDYKQQIKKLNKKLKADAVQAESFQKAQEHIKKLTSDLDHMTKKNNAYQLECDKINVENTNLKNEIAKHTLRTNVEKDIQLKNTILNETNNNLAQEVGRLKREISARKKNNEGFVNEKLQFQQELSALRNENMNLLAAAEIKEEEILKLNNDFDNLNEIYFNLLRGRELDNERNLLTQEELNSEIVTREDVIRELQSAVEEKSARENVLLNLLKANFSQALLQKKVNGDNSIGINKNCNQEINEVVTWIIKLQNENAIVVKEREEFNKLIENQQEEIDGIREKLAKALDENMCLKKAIENSNLDSNRKLEWEIENKYKKLQEENLRLRNEKINGLQNGDIDKKEIVVGGLKTKLDDQTDEFSADFRKLYEQSLEFENEKLNLENEIERIKNEHVEVLRSKDSILSASHKRIADLKKTKTECVQEIHCLKEQLQQIKDSGAKWVREFIDLKNNFNEMKDDNEELVEANKKFRQNMEEVECLKITYNDEINALKCEKQENKLVEELRSELRDKESDIETYLQEIAVANEENQQLMQKIENLESKEENNLRDLKQEITAVRYNEQLKLNEAEMKINVLKKEQNKANQNKFGDLNKTLEMKEEIIRSCFERINFLQDESLMEIQDLKIFKSALEGIIAEYYNEFEKFKSFCNESNDINEEELLEKDCIIEFLNEKINSLMVENERVESKLKANFVSDLARKEAIIVSLTEEVDALRAANLEAVLSLKKAKGEIEANLLQFIDDFDKFKIEINDELNAKLAEKQATIEMLLKIDEKTKDVEHDEILKWKSQLKLEVNSAQLINSESGKDMEIVALKAEMKIMKRTITETFAEFDSLRLLMNKLKDQTEQMHEENDKLQAQVALKESLQNCLVMENNKIELNFISLTEELKTFKNKCTHLQEENQQLECVRHESKMLIEDVASLKRDRNGINSQLNKILGEVFEIESKLLDLQSEERAKMQNEVLIYKEEIKNLMVQNEYIERECHCKIEKIESKFHEKLRSKDKENSDLKEEITRLKGAKTKLREYKAELMSQIKMLRTKLTDSRRDLDIQTEKSRNADEILLESARQFQLQDDFTKLPQFLHELNQKLLHVNNECDELHEVNKKLSDAHDEKFKAEAEELRRLRKALQTEEKQMQTKLMNKRKQLFRLEERYRARWLDNKRIIKMNLGDRSVLKERTEQRAAHVNFIKELFPDLKMPNFASYERWKEIVSHQIKNKVEHFNKIQEELQAIKESGNQLL